MFLLCFVLSWHEEPPFTKITQSKWYAEPRRRFWVYVTVRSSDPFSHILCCPVLELKKPPLHLTQLVWQLPGFLCTRCLLNNVCVHKPWQVPIDYLGEGGGEVARGLGSDKKEMMQRKRRGDKRKVVARPRNYRYDCKLHGFSPWIIPVWTCLFRFYKTIIHSTATRHPWGVYFKKSIKKDWQITGHPQGSQLCERSTPFSPRDTAVFGLNLSLKGPGER